MAPLISKVTLSRFWSSCPFWEFLLRFLNIGVKTVKVFFTELFDEDPSSGRKCRVFFWKILSQPSTTILLARWILSSLCSLWADSPPLPLLYGNLYFGDFTMAISCGRCIEMKMHFMLVFMLVFDVFFRKIRGIYAHAAFAPSTGISFGVRCGNFLLFPGRNRLYSISLNVRSLVPYISHSTIMCWNLNVWKGGRGIT